MERYTINQLPSNKDIDEDLLSYDQKEIRNNAKKIYHYGDEMQCNCCGKILPIDEFYVKDRHTGRRSKKCKDCQMKQMGVIELGKQRYADKILSKGFRRCSVCKEIKPLYKFTKSKTGYGGYANNCYSCSQSLHHKYIIEQNRNIGDHYVSQYVLRKYGIKQLSDTDLDKYRNEIIQKRQPRYAFDDKTFATPSMLAKYLFKKYKIPRTRSIKRLQGGCSPEECLISESKWRSFSITKGKIRVTDVVTGDIMYFKSTRDEGLLSMFSSDCVSRCVLAGGGTSRVTKLSKYKNPCKIERIISL